MTGITPGPAGSGPPGDGPDGASPDQADAASVQAPLPITAPGHLGSPLLIPRPGVAPGPWHHTFYRT